MTTTGGMTWEEAVQWLRDQPDQQDLVRWCFYDDPLLEAARRFHASTEWRATRQLLPAPPGAALDLGAGRGIASYALAADGYQTTALEPDPGALVGAGAIRKLSEQSGLPIRVEEQWGESLPFADRSFDVVLCRQVLHHARDLRQLCAETARVLKPGGHMVATREHVLSQRSDLGAFLGQHPLHALYGGENAYLLEEYQSAITAAGLELEASLNPMQTDINLYPATLEDRRAHIARKFMLPRAVITDWMLAKAGARMTMPGRLYTFVAHRPA